MSDRAIALVRLWELRDRYDEIAWENDHPGQSWHPAASKSDLRDVLEAVIEVLERPDIFHRHPECLALPGTDDGPCVRPAGHAGACAYRRRGPA